MEEKSLFKRVLNSRDVIALAFGAAIGWGWVVLAGDWLLMAGTLGAIIAFLIGGVAIVFVGLTYAELTAALPLCGGEHVFSMRGFGRTGSFICTWALILGYVGVVAFEACALPSVVDFIVPNLSVGYMYEIAGFKVYGSWVAIGIFGAVVVTVINYIGIKPSAVLQRVLTVAILAVGILLICGASVSGSASNLRPLFTKGPVSGVLSVAVMTPFFLFGFDVTPQAAEEINMPFNKMGKVLIFSIILAVAWYILVIFAVSLVLTGDEMAASGLVTAFAMKKAYGGRDIAATVLVVGGIAGIISTWNAFFLAGSRCVFAMARSGMLPASLGRLHPKHGTPTNAILLIGGLSCVAPFFGKGMMTWLSDAGGLAVVVAYFMVSVSFLLLRKKEPELERPYRLKHGKFVGVTASLLTLFFIVLYMPGMPSGLIWPNEWIIIILWIVLGLILFAACKRKESR